MFTLMMIIIITDHSRFFLGNGWGWANETRETSSNTAADLVILHSHTEQ